MKKAFYFDVETTGLDAYKNDIIQIAGLIEINGDIEDEFNYKIMPFDIKNVDQKALDVNKTTIEELKTFAHPKEVHKLILEHFGKFVSKYDKTDKFCPIGYNVNFDIGFLRSFFLKCGDKYYGSWINNRAVDPLSKLYEWDYLNKINLPDYKLSTVCAHFNIQLNAHDALSDIRATRQVLKLLIKDKILDFSN